VELNGRLLQDDADVRRWKLLLEGDDFLVQVAAVRKQDFVREEPVLDVGLGKGRGGVLRGLSYIHRLISSGPTIKRQR
jgi:hypothetical protein